MSSYNGVILIVAILFFGFLWYVMDPMIDSTKDLLPCMGTHCTAVNALKTIVNDFIWPFLGVILLFLWFIPYWYNRTQKQF